MSKDIVNVLMENFMVIERFAKVRRSSSDNIKKEIVFNLLQNLLTLYIPVRIFYYFKDKVQAFKIRNSKKKRSLRTGMKQSISFRQYFVPPLHNRILRSSLFRCRKSNFSLPWKEAYERRLIIKTRIKLKCGFKIILNGNYRINVISVKFLITFFAHNLY